MTAATALTSPSDHSLAARLDAVRALMRGAQLDALWVRSTDAHLNEYVPLEESTRAWLTGFTGSVGEALVTHDGAWVFVDGRYWLQADSEVQAFNVVKVPLGTAPEQAALEQLQSVLTKRPKLRVGYEPDRFSQFELERVQKATAGAVWIATDPSLVERARGPIARESKPLRALDEGELDLGSQQKLTVVGEALAKESLAGLFVQTLDEVAYLTNLRGSDLPFQVTFRSVAYLSGGRLLVGVAQEALSDAVKAARPAIDFVDLAAFDKALALRVKKARVGYDPKLTSARWVQRLKDSGAEVVALPSPVGPLKAKKGKKELKAMTAAFARADKVIEGAIAWLCEEVSKRKVVSEADFAAEVRERFFASGATGLSFDIISAAGRNGAIVHYSKPNPKRIIKQGELVLLDTGAYYDEGYATDLTRTFLVGPKSQKASAEQKRYYTLTLKAAIAGMRARIPVGTRGDQLDAIVRAPLWAQGLNYNHGTGHGVGINVHEFPPRIGTTGTAALEEGMVFSIEPGVYLERFGGIRIENLCTLERITGVPGYLQVRPLTFSPLDQRLIERKLLNEEERAWLAQYLRGRAPK
ncbi:MAG: M24 family metallopeptidase [Deltaproteobacteria bacterium]|nr:M24 family metallopeptidase [Deltaproteobacteria bacterium]